MVSSRTIFYVLLWYIFFFSMPSSNCKEWWISSAQVSSRRVFRSSHEACERWKQSWAMYQSCSSEEKSHQISPALLRVGNHLSLATLRLGGDMFMGRALAQCSPMQFKRWCNCLTWVSSLIWAWSSTRSGISSKLAIRMAWCGVSEAYAP